MATLAGQATVSWRARPATVGRAILAHGFILLAVPLPPFLLALAEAEWALAATLAPAVALAIGAGIAARGLGTPDDLRGIEAVVTFVALFFLSALLPVPAYLVLGLPPVDAVFESVSAITSTGLTLATGTMDWPLAGHLLRGWMQWCGGFAIAVAGVALLFGPGHAAHRMGQAGLSERDILSSTRAQARDLLIVYAVITVVAVALLIALLPTWWEGVAVALAAVSTGGFTPRPDSLASYSRAAQAATMAIALSTAFSLFAYVVLKRAGLKKAVFGTNVAPTLALCLAGCGLVAGAAWLGGGDVAGGVLNFVSGFTTAGFSVKPIDDPPVVVALLLVAMLIGGGIGSTAGGIKVDRVVSLAGMVRLSLLRLSIPKSAVTFLTENKRRVAADRIVAIASIFALYAASALIAWLVFLGSGQPPLPALFDIVSALSTVGLSTGVTSPDLAAHLKIVLTVAMLLGRLEFLALIAALSPATWSGRR